MAYSSHDRYDEVMKFSVEKPPPYNPHFIFNSCENNSESRIGNQANGANLCDKPVVPRRLYYGNSGGSLSVQRQPSRRSVPNLRSNNFYNNNFYNSNFYSEPNNSNICDQPTCVSTKHALQSNTVGRRLSSGMNSNNVGLSPECALNPTAPVIASTPFSYNSWRSNAILSNIQLVTTFGSFSEDCITAGKFVHPTRISISSDGQIVVVDSQYMAIHVFNSKYEPCFALRVIGIQAACLLVPDKNYNL